MIRHGLAVALRHEVTVQRVEEAGNAEEAVALASQHEFDVAVVDSLMPKTSGIRLARQLHELQPQCRVVALSVIDDPGLIADKLRAHASGFAFKTQPIGDIVEAMQAVLGGTTADIASELVISPRTVESHRQRITSKLSVSSVHKMRRFAVRYGCLET